MQQVQDRLEFQIETPSDEELIKAFGRQFDKLEDYTRDIPQKLSQPAITRNQKKRARRKSRRHA